MGIFSFISDLFKEDVIMEPTTESGKKIGYFSVLG